MVALKICLKFYKNNSSENYSVIGVLNQFNLNKNKFSKFIF